MVSLPLQWNSENLPEKVQEDKSEGAKVLVPADLEGAALSAQPLSSRHSP
jgi:hypothetical protein